MPPIPAPGEAAPVAASASPATGRPSSTTAVRDSGRRRSRTRRIAQYTTTSAESASAGPGPPSSPGVSGSASRATTATTGRTGGHCRTRGRVRAWVMCSAPRRAHERGRGAQQDADVLPQRPVVDVGVVEAGPVLDGGVPAQTVDLGKAGDAGPHAVAGRVTRVGLAELGDEVRAFGARADQAHVAPQDVPQLEQLVQ